MRRGHTLIELLVVLIVLGVAGSLVLPPIAPKRRGIEAAGIEVRSVLERALRDAVMRGERAHVTIDLPHARYWIGGAKTWPRDVWRTGTLNSEGITYSGGSSGILEFDIGSNGSAIPLRVSVTDGNDTIYVHLDAGAAWPVIR